MRRIVTSFFVLFLLLLTACGGGGGNSNNGSNGNSSSSTQGLTSGNSYNTCPDNASTNAAPAESGPVTLTVSYASSSPAEDALVHDNLNKFHQANPNININYSPISGDYTTKMRANIASNTVPDVFYLTPDMSPEYIKGGKLVNLSPYMARDKVSASDYYPSLLNPFTCTKGSVFGIPKDWNALGVFYNKQMLQAAGLSAPKANWTWNDMQTYAQKMTKNAGSPNSVYGISMSPDLSRWGAFLIGNGGSVLNSDGTRATFNNQAGVSSLQYYDSFLKNNTGTLPTGVGAPWNGDAFGKQRVAMAIEGGWLIPYLAQQYSSVQYDIAPMPVSPTGKNANLIYTNSWAAYSGTKHSDAAWQLIKYMTGSEVQTSQLNAGFALPTLKSLASAPYFASHPGFKVLFDSASYGYADYYGPQDQSIHNIVATALQSVMLNKQTPQQALDDAAKKVNSQLQV
ncbi:MAG: ABC transporter substrate-binding protein [Ktedonobacteraceae bacterium]